MQGMWVESYGSLTTDIYNLSTATAIYVSTYPSSYPSMESRHPLWSHLQIEKRTVTVENTGFTRIVCEYAGFEGQVEPVIEWSSGVTEEPIETHPEFDNFAGDPDHPVNNSMWEGGSFVGFGPGTNFAGVTSYLVPVLVKRVTTIEPTTLSVESAVGHLFGSMLCTSASSVKRGKVYHNTIEYRGAGPRGWNLDIY
jgi:hypothetical protein